VPIRILVAAVLSLTLLAACDDGGPQEEPGGRETPAAEPTDEAPEGAEPPSAGEDAMPLGESRED
jgi:hypothetical protein